MTVLTLKRVRLELDRALRSRAFFARATQGILGIVELLDLEAQLGCLLEQAGGELAADLLRLVQRDRRAFERAEPLPRVKHRAAPVLLLIHDLLRSDWLDTLPRELSYRITLAVAGTSWTRDAALALGDRIGAGTEFLFALSHLGHGATRQLEQGLEAGTLPCEQTYAAIELARGIVLGLASHLDETWPARSTLLTLPIPLPILGETT